MLAIRVAGQFDKRDGYVRDAVTGFDYLNRNNYSLRFGLQFNPTDTIRSYTAVSYVDVKEHGGGSILLAVNPARPYAALLQPYLLAQQARGVRETALSVPTREVAKAFLALNNTEFDLSDTLTLKNIFSYARTRSTSATDRDSTPLPIAPSGETTSWQSRDPTRAARSAAGSGLVSNVMGVTLPSRISEAQT